MTFFYTGNGLWVTTPQAVMTAEHDGDTHTYGYVGVIVVRNERTGREWARRWGDGDDSFISQFDGRMMVERTRGEPMDTLLPSPQETSNG